MMSVSFIVPVWREDVYVRVCLPWIKQQVEWYGAELIEVRGAKSIFQALERGRQQATHRYLFYVHDDVRLLRPTNLVPQIVQAFSTLRDTGLIGPVGKVKRQCVPWWKNPGAVVGHYCVRDGRGAIVYHYTKSNGRMAVRGLNDAVANTKPEFNWGRFAQAGLVDGFFLCEDRERLNVAWDTETFGDQWHAYDMDRCLQAHALGLQVLVPHWLFLHDCAGHAGYKGTKPQQVKEKGKLIDAGDRLWLSDLEIVNNALRQKWGVQ